MTLAANPWQWVADAWADPTDVTVDAFEVLGYEPNCLPRIRAAQEAGFNTPPEAVRAGVELSAPCGRCPQEQFHAATEDDVLFGGQAGGGKGLQRSTPVLTPFGFKVAGDVRVGDQLSNPDGSVSRVIAVHDRGWQPCWRVVTSDGAELVCDDDHLWQVRLSGVPIKRAIEWRVTTAPALAAQVDAARAQKAAGHRPHWPLIPLMEPAEFTVTSRFPDGRWPVPPYVLGALLGDGCLSAGSGVSLTSRDPEIVEPVRQWVESIGGRIVTSDDGLTHRLVSPYAGPRRSALRKALESIECWAHRAEAKSVPSAYMVAPLSIRRAIVRGLMDTDGHADSRGHASFVSVSKQLARDVQWLVRSLGFKATLTEKAAGYRGADGVRIACQTAYTVTMTGRNAAELFHLERKRARCGEPQQRGMRRIVSMDRVPDAETVCFTVDHPNGLFIAGDGFMVTHNSRALVMEGIRACVRYPGIWVAGYRRTYDELAESLLKLLQQLRYAADLGASWNKTEKELTFPPRAGKVSKFRFRYAESIDDAVRRQGGDYQLLLVDERTLMPPGVVPVLQERLRSSDPDVPVLGTRCTANPGGPGHGETKAAYIDATDDGAKVVTDAHGVTRRFIRSRLSDNPYLDRDQSYHRTLDAIPDPARRKAMKEGDWSVFAGQFFAAWSRERHVVEPMSLPATWDREEGIDYGYAAPWAVLVGAFDNDGRCWITHELYDTGVGQTDQAKRILATESGAGVAPVARHADPSMWAKTGEANSNAGIYADEGCTLRRAVNDRVNGWARVLEYLTEMPACDLHRSRGWATCPRLHVFSSCTNLIRTLPNAPRDKNKPEDIDTTCEDHLADCLRYLLMGRGVPIEPVAPVELPQANPWDLADSAADFGGWDMAADYDSGYGR